MKTLRMNRDNLEENIVKNNNNGDDDDARLMLDSVKDINASGKRGLTLKRPYRNQSNTELKQRNNEATHLQSNSFN